MLTFFLAAFRETKGKLKSLTFSFFKVKNIMFKNCCVVNFDRAHSFSFHASKFHKELRTQKKLWLYNLACMLDTTLKEHGKKQRVSLTATAQVAKATSHCA